MIKRLTDKNRKALEKKYAALKQVRALFEPGKAESIVGSVGENDPNIQKVVEKLMALMGAEGEAGKYHTANKKALVNLVKMAFCDEPGHPQAADEENDAAPEGFGGQSPFGQTTNEADETPEEEGEDLENPALHPVEDLEHEVQTMDDPQLQQAVESLENKIKEHLGLNKEENSPEEGQEEMNPGPSLNSEQKLAILMNLPNNVRVAKAQNLRALANVLDPYTKEVSNNNFINNTETPDESLANDYKDEEYGSMKDVEKVAAFKQVALQLLASAEALEEEEEKVGPKDDEEDAEKTAKQATLQLALRHFVASLDDMEDEEEEGEKKEASLYAKADDESDEKEAESLKKVDEDEKEEDDEKEVKTAILKARLASLRRKANVDGKKMSSPKEVPHPEGTTADNLKGDAKIQYSTSTAEGNNMVHDRREKVPNDVQVAGNEEPNEIYFSNSPYRSPSEHATSEKDSSKSVNNKRILRDNESATFSDETKSPTEHLEKNPGSHQNPKEWETAKSESDKTPTGERLVGLANLNINEIVKQRTERAVKLAGLMSNKGLIRTEADLREKISKLASFDDAEFAKYAEFVEDTNTSVNEEKEKPWEKAKKESDKDVAGKDGESDDEKEEYTTKEAFAGVRRASAGSLNLVDEPRETGGLKRAFVLSPNADMNLKESIKGKLRSLGWSDPNTTAQQINEKQAFLSGNLPSGFLGGPEPLI